MNSKFANRDARSLGSLGKKCAMYSIVYDRAFLQYLHSFMRSCRDQIPIYKCGVLSYSPNIIMTVKMNTFFKNKNEIKIINKSSDRQAIRRYLNCVLRLQRFHFGIWPDCF